MRLLERSNSFHDLIARAVLSPLNIQSESSAVGVNNTVSAAASCTNTHTLIRPRKAHTVQQAV